MILNKQQEVSLKILVAYNKSFRDNIRKPKKFSSTFKEANISTNFTFN